MHDLVGAIIRRDRAIGREEWDSFWDSLEQGSLERRDAVSVAALLSARPPDSASAGALIDSLDARRDLPAPQNAVNIVGTGGGPQTFNISTASALVAATLGARVIKSGSRAYSSRYGSIDALELLGVRLASSYGGMQDSLEQFGIAFTGRFVYPPQLTLLAKCILPLDMRKAGKFFNYIGPFLAAVPVSAQLTGVADHRLLPLMRYLATRSARRRVWLCFNRLGVDELVSFEKNMISRNDRFGDLHLTPKLLGLAPGSLADLRAARDANGIVRQFEAILEGDGPPAAIESICLNAAALVVVGGVGSEWADAIRAASQVIERGHARALLHRLREHEPKRVAPAQRRPRGRGSAIAPRF